MENSQLQFLGNLRCCSQTPPPYDAYPLLIRTLLEKFDGGPAGIETLAAAVGEDRGTLEDVVEPYLIHRGFLSRTPRGRVATRLAREYFGMPLPYGFGSQPKLL